MTGYHKDFGSSTRASGPARVSTATKGNMDTVSLEAKMIHLATKSWLCEIAGFYYWVPTSQILSPNPIPNSVTDTVITIVLPEWLQKKLTPIPEDRIKHYLE